MLRAKMKERPAAHHRIQMLPVDKLVPSPDNRRSTLSKASVRSLAQSIKKDGLIQPIVVRPHPTKHGHWEIRAGARRWLAAQVAGLKLVPAIVRALDDPAALAVTIAENVQRQNLHPLEEAATIQQAFDRGYDIAAIASKLGKSVPYVARRASLSRLAEAWRAAFLKPESPVSRLSPAHLELIARLPEETQLLLAENDFLPVFGRGFPTVEDVRRVVDRGMHALAAMPWPVDDETLDPAAGACVSCPKRSGAQPMLFDGEVCSKNGKPSPTDRCLDPACFERKQVAHVRRREVELRQAHPNLKLVQIAGGPMSPVAVEAFGEQVQRVYGPRFVKAGDKRAVPVIQVDGPKAGKLVYIEADEIERHNGVPGVRGRPPKGERKPQTLDERRAAHQRRRQAFVVKQVETRLRELSLDGVTQALAERRQRAGSDGQPIDIVALVLAFGSSIRPESGAFGSPWEQFDKLRETDAETRAAIAVHAVLPVWIRRLVIQDRHQIGFQAVEAQRICELLGIDYAAIAAEAVQTLPQPKNWGSVDDPGLTAPPPAPCPPAVIDPEPDQVAESRPPSPRRSRRRQGRLKRHNRR